MKIATLTKILLASVVTVAASSSYASLTLLTAENFSGSGLGAVNTVLTIQGTGNVTTEAGSVVRMTTPSGVQDQTTGDAKTGASQSLTRTLSSLGVTTAAGLRVVFNADESDNAINLTGLMLNIYAGDSTTILFTAGLDQSSYPFPNTRSGIGNSGFVFGLTPAEITEAQTKVFSLAGFGLDRVGLSASASGVSGGPETFFVAQSGTNGGGGGSGSGNVPEPASLALLGLGLLGVVASRRKSIK